MSTLDMNNNGDDKSVASSVASSVETRKSTKQQLPVSTLPLPLAIPGIMKILSMPQSEKFSLSKGLSAQRKFSMIKPNPEIAQSMPKIEVQETAPTIDMVPNSPVVLDVMERVRRNSSSSIKSGGSTKSSGFSEKMLRGQSNMVSTIMNRPTRRNVKGTKKFAEAFRSNFKSIELERPVEIEVVQETDEKQANGNFTIELEMKFQSEDSWIKCTVEIDKNVLIIQMRSEYVPPIEIDLRKARIKRDEDNISSIFVVETSSDSFVFRSSSPQVSSECMQQLLSATINQEEANNSTSPVTKGLSKSPSQVSVLTQPSGLMRRKASGEPKSAETVYSGWSNHNEKAHEDNDDDDDEYEYVEVTDDDEDEGEDEEATSPKSNNKPAKHLSFNINSPTNSTNSAKKSPMIGGHDRSKLMQSQFSKPKVSIQKLKLYVNWINSLQIWPQEISILTLHKHVSNGLLLCQILCRYTSIDLLGLNEKSLARKSAIANLELALSYLLKCSGISRAMIPSASDVYDGNTSKITILTKAMFDATVLGNLIASIPDMVKWYDNILKQYDRGMSMASHKDPKTHLWDEFRSGTALFCVIYHFTGNPSVSKELNSNKVDFLRVYKDPKNIREYRENISYAFQLLQSHGIAVVWTVDDWLSSFDFEFLAYQLKNIFDKFCKKQCILPPAHGSSAGVSCNVTGEHAVIGLLYADDFCSQLPRRVRSILMANNKNSMALSYPPVESNEGLVIPNFPHGLVSSTIYRMAATSIDNNPSSVNISANFQSSSNDLLKQEESRLVTVLKSFKFKYSSSTNARIVLAWASLRIIGLLKQEVNDRRKIYEDGLNIKDENICARETELEASYGEMETRAGDMEEAEYEDSLNELEMIRQELEDERNAIEKDYEDKCKLFDLQMDEVESLDKFESISDYFKSVCMSSSINTSPKKKFDLEKDKWQIYALERQVSVEEKKKMKMAKVKEISVAQGRIEAKSKTKETNMMLVQPPVQTVREVVRPELSIAIPPLVVSQTSIDDDDEGDTGLPELDEYQQVMKSIRDAELKKLEIEEYRTRGIIKCAARKSPPQLLLTTFSSASNVLSTLNKKSHTVTNSSKIPHSILSPPQQSSNHLVVVMTPDDVMQRMMTGEGIESPRFARVDTSGLDDDEIESYFTWLSNPMRAKLKDRNSERDYDFTVVEGSRVTQEKVREASYAIKWSYPSSMRAIGFVSFIDIQSITLNDRVVNVTLKAKVIEGLRNSGGRNVVSVLFPSASEAEKYKSVLHIIASL